MLEMAKPRKPWSTRSRSRQRLAYALLQGMTRAQSGGQGALNRQDLQGTSGSGPILQ
jgi:hypothetical protein